MVLRLTEIRSNIDHESTETRVYTANITEIYEMLSDNYIISDFRNIYKNYYGKEERMALKNAVYENYERLRDRKGLNNAQVATAAKIPMSTIYDWAAGRYMPKTDKLMAIARVLEVTLEELLNVKED